MFQIGRFLKFRYKKITSLNIPVRNDEKLDR